RAALDGAGPVGGWSGARPARRVGSEVATPRLHGAVAGPRRTARARARRFGRMAGAGDGGARHRMRGGGCRRVAGAARVPGRWRRYRAGRRRACPQPLSRGTGQSRVPRARHLRGATTRLARPVRRADRPRLLPSAPGCRRSGLCRQPVGVEQAGRPAAAVRQGVPDRSVARRGGGAATGEGRRGRRARRGLPDRTRRGDLARSGRGPQSRDRAAGARVLDDEGLLTGGAAASEGGTGSARTVHAGPGAPRTTSPARGAAIAGRMPRMPSHPLSRREFLKTSAFAAAAVGLAGRSAGAASEPLYRISLAEWSINRPLFSGQMQHLDFARIAKSVGIDAIEYVNQFFMDKATDKAYLREMNTRAQGEGVTQVLIMCDNEGNLGDPDPAKRTKAVENHCRWVEAAAFLGCHTVRVNGYSAGTPEEQMRLVADGMRRLCEFADQHGINVVIENHGGLSSNAKWLVETIRMTDHPRAGTLPDFGNFRISGPTRNNPDAPVVS